jgi:hypothetical protein
MESMCLSTAAELGHCSNYSQAISWCIHAQPPVVISDTEENSRLSRRVEFKITKNRNERIPDAENS